MTNTLLTDSQDGVFTFTKPFGNDPCVQFEGQPVCHSYFPDPLLDGMADNIAGVIISHPAGMPYATQDLENLQNTYQELDRPFVGALGLQGTGQVLLYDPANPFLLCVLVGQTGHGYNIPCQ